MELGKLAEHKLYLFSGSLVLIGRKKEEEKLKRQYVRRSEPRF